MRQTKLFSQFDAAISKYLLLWNHTILRARIQGLRHIRCFSVLFRFSFCFEKKESRKFGKVYTVTGAFNAPLPYRKNLDSLAGSIFVSIGISFFLFFLIFCENTFFQKKIKIHFFKRKYISQYTKQKTDKHKRTLLLRALLMHILFNVQIKVFSSTFQRNVLMLLSLF